MHTVWCYYLTNCCPNNLHPWIYMIFLLPFVFEVFEVHWCFHFSRVYDHSYSCQADAERATGTLAVILTLNPLEFHLWLCNVVSQSFKSCEMQLQRHLKSCLSSVSPVSGRRTRLPDAVVSSASRWTMSGH